MKLNEIEHDISLISVHYWLILVISVIFTCMGFFDGMGWDWMAMRSQKNPVIFIEQNRNGPQINFAYACFELRVHFTPKA